MVQILIEEGHECLRDMDAWDECKIRQCQKNANK